MRGHIEWFESVLHVTIGVYFQQQGFENASVNHFFPMPSEELRAELWRGMLPREWLGDDAEELIATAAQSKLSGGSIANVARKCAVQLINKPLNKVNKNVILTALNIEKNNWCIVGLIVSGNVHYFVQMENTRFEIESRILCFIRYSIIECRIPMRTYRLFPYYSIGIWITDSHCSGSSWFHAPSM